LNAIMNPSFAMLGWAEILIIMVVLGFMAAGVVAVIVIAITMSRKKPATSPATSAPPVLPSDPAGCPRCGTPLGPGVAQGLCPKCVLAAGFETQAATEPSDEPARDPSTIPGAA
jgi:hypothetical protein